MFINNAKIMVNNRCNLRCSYCCLTPQNKKELSVNEWVYLLAHLKTEYNTQFIDLFGKEPLFDRKSFDIIEKLHKKGIYFEYSMITNGVNLKKYRAEILEYLNSISISYSGLDKGREYIFDCNSITELAKRNMCIEVSYDLQQGNKHRLITDLQSFWNMGVGSVYLKPILDYNNTSSDFAMSEAEYGEIIDDLIRKLPLNVPYLVVHIPFIFSKLTKRYGNTRTDNIFEIQSEPKCLCDGSFVFIDCDGTAYPCGECLSLNNQSLGFDFMHTPKEEVYRNLQSKGERLCMVRK